MNCHRLRHPIIRNWVAIGGIATFIVATKKEPQAEYALGVLKLLPQVLPQVQAYLAGGWGIEGWGAAWIGLT